MSHKVLLVDEHRITRDGIKALIERSGEFDVAAEAENGSDAVQILQGINPDLVVIVVGTPSQPAIATTRLILQHSATARVVLLSMTQSEEPIIAAFNAGARGLVLNKAAGRLAGRSANGGARWLLLWFWHSTRQYGREPELFSQNADAP